AVLVIELGGGASLAIGMALSDRSVSVGRDAPGNTGLVTPSCDAGVAAGVTAPGSPSMETPAAAALQGGSQGGVPGNRPARDRVLQLVLDAKGLLRTSHRALGTVLGVSAARAGRIVGELAAAGVIRVRTSSTGTVISLVGVIEPPASVH